MNIYFVLAISALVFKYLLDAVVGCLNISKTSTSLPPEFRDVYSPERYAKSQLYLRSNTKFNFIKDTFFLAVFLFFILSGGFNFIDIIARKIGHGQVITGLIFAAILFLLFFFLGLAFDAYHTFVLEERYRFNRTTAKTFVLDAVKTLMLEAIIGGILLSFIIWLFLNSGKTAWLYCWVGVSSFRIFLAFIAPAIIMPMFYDFAPLEEGGLRKEIENYARSQNFALQGIFKIDASRRSTKTNAFFTGFGRYRRIALFDTLIKNHTIFELVAVLAHEIGHYKKKHILKNTVFSIFMNGVMFYLFSFFINNRQLFAAFGMDKLSIYASFIFFGILYMPLVKAFSIIQNALSRRFEFEADRFAVMTYNKPQEFISVLKKLSADNLSNLTPHPAKVLIDYSHPPVLDRIKYIKNLE